MLASNNSMACEIAARPRQAGDEAGTDRVGDGHEHDRDTCAVSRCSAAVAGDAMYEDHVGLQGDQLFRQHLGLSAGRCKAIVNADISALRPS